jgi:signal transduction histidine kinase
MFKHLFNPRSSHDFDIPLEKISVTGRARLLDMAYSRLRFGLFSMPVVSGVFAWYYSHSGGDLRVLYWALGYLLSAVATVFINQIYRRDQQTLSAQQTLERWLPRIHCMVILHGLGLFVLLPIVHETATMEFRNLYLLAVAAIMASNATHQAPTLSVFNRFLTVGWHCTVLVMPWTLASHWQFVMPLCAIYSIGMYRHGLESHRFFVRMLWLEEEGSRLAESYRASKEIAENALTAKNQFLTTASHDLRQPIHAMDFLIESIAQRNQDPILIPALKDLKQSVRSVTQMFNSLLDLSKIEAGAVALKNEAIALNDFVQEIAQMFAEEARSRQLRLRVKTAPDNPTVIADSMLLRQSINNLMHNALRYTHRGGVLIAIRKRGSFWQLEVWDTGIGIATEDQDKIYSPFFRHEHAWRIDSAGHGLGLAVVARCCNLMQVHYGLTSELGRGSRFWLRLPAVTAPSTKPTISAATNVTSDWPAHR